MIPPSITPTSTSPGPLEQAKPAPSPLLHQRLALLIQMWYYDTTNGSVLKRQQLISVINELHDCLSQYEQAPRRILASSRTIWHEYYEHLVSHKRFTPQQKLTIWNFLYEFSSVPAPHRISVLLEISRNFPAASEHP